MLRVGFIELIKTGRATKNPVSLAEMFEVVQREWILTYEEEDEILEAIEKADKRYQHLKDTI